MLLCLSFFWMAGAASAQAIQLRADGTPVLAAAGRAIGRGAIHEPGRAARPAAAGRAAGCGDCKASLALLSRAAADSGLDPHLVHAVAWAESGFRPEAVSAKGAMGLMQLMPATARQYGVSDPFDPWQNAQGGSRLLRDLLDRYAGDARLALAAYNAGPLAVERAGRAVPDYPETQAYVTKVLARQRHLLAGAQPWRAAVPPPRLAGHPEDLRQAASGPRQGPEHPHLSSRRIGNALLLIPVPAPRNLPGPLDS